MQLDYKRRLLIAATAGVGGVGLLASTLPFIASLAPS
jgi:hypothetical protein